MIGLGFTVGDEHIDEPYFYASPFPQPAAADLPDLGPVGAWHTEGFITASLRASDLRQADDPAATSRDFLRHAIALERRLIGAADGD